MSWLRNHIRHYVVRGIRAIVKAQRELKTGGVLREPFSGKIVWYDAKPSVLDIPRRPINLRPAKGFKTKEQGLVWTALNSFNAPMPGLLRAVAMSKLPGPIFPQRADALGLESLGTESTTS